MNEAHFFLKIEEHMIAHTKLLLKSIEAFSGLDNFYISIMIPKNQKCSDKYLLKKSKFIHYENIDLDPPWSGAIRYFLEPSCDVCFFLDVDTLIVDSILDLVEKVKKNKKIYAVPAFLGGIQEKTWRDLYKQFHIENDVFIKNLKGGCSPLKYVNAGVVAMNADLASKLAPFVKEYVYLINSKKIEYKGQVSLCLALEKSGLNLELLDYKFNFDSSLTIDNFNSAEDYYKSIMDLRIIHFCWEKNFPYDFNSVFKNSKLTRCIKEINRKKIFI